jgi:flagellin
MVINTNLQAQTASVRLLQSSAMLAQSLQRLSSGSRLASPSDDSAGLAVSMRLSAKLARIGADRSNIGNAISFSQTQDGYLQRVNDALNRLGELSMLSLDSTKTDADRSLYQQEFQALGGYIGGVAAKDFNGVSLFFAGNIWVPTDSELSNRTNFLTMAGVDLNSPSLAAAVGDNIRTSAAATTALRDVKGALDFLAASRANVGLNLESLTFYDEQLAMLSTNMSAAKSRITDVDIAQESTNYAKLNILVQSGTAMLAQANALPQSVLKLLG